MKITIGELKMAQNPTKMDVYNDMRKQQVNDKKEEVLKAALELFIKNDIVSISMRDIAKSVGISRATMYRYFDDKEEIVFIIASRMMAEIRYVAFKDVNFNTSKEITIGYKNMVERFDQLTHAYQYMAMFDALYTTTHPSKNLSSIYTGQIQHLFKGAIKKLSPEEIIRHTMMINLTMDFLEDLAFHRYLIPQTQGISIQNLLNEFEKTIDSIMQI
jgi:AcrR family transcriptional regulator